MRERRRMKKERFVGREGIDNKINKIERDIQESRKEGTKRRSTKRIYRIEREKKKKKN
jgi:hypothetical protein